MITRTRVTAILLLLLAGLLTFYKVPVASSQGITLQAELVSDDLPSTNPASELWQQASAVEIPLSAQQTTEPFLGEGGIRSLTARALYDGTQIAILVEWADSTLDDQMIRVQDFRDAVAAQFPLVEGQPFFCMGQIGGNVNIWHWKADWQADLTARQDVETVYPDMHVDYYQFTDTSLGALAGPGDYEDTNYLTALAAGNLLASNVRSSPVEDLVAGGFGTMTAQAADEQNVAGHGVWADQRWRVIFLRELASSEGHDVSFTPGQVYPLAFAVWDGSNGERDGQKSTSQWISLQLGRAPAVTAPEIRPAAAPENREPLIFVLGPMAAVLVLIGLGLGGVAILGSLMERRKK